MILGPLVPAMEDLVLGHSDGARTFDAAFDLDMAGFGYFAIQRRRVGGDVPSAFLGRDVHHAAATGFFGEANGVHGKQLDSGAGFGVGGKCGGDWIGCSFPAQFPQQSLGHDERTTEH